MPIIRMMLPSTALSLLNCLLDIFLVANNDLQEAWTELHQNELIENWERLQQGEQPIKIEPLK